MRTRITTSEARKPSARALIGTTAATLALLGGALLWQARPASETAAPAATASATIGGMAERSGEQQAPPATSNIMAEAGEERAAATTHMLVVASPGYIPEAYVRFVERHRALDGATPLAVTVVAGSADSSENDAYAQFVERLMALDGSTPVAVTVVDERPGGLGGATTSAP